MRIKYIDQSGNFAELETLLDLKRETKLEKIGNVYFEKKEAEPVKAEKKDKVEAKVEEIVGEFDEVAAKEYLKSK